jgi:hypothetical protein
MRRGLLTLLALIGSISPAWAQNHFFSTPPTPPSVKVSADEVVARLMTFDQNTDGRVAFTELSERMRPLVERGDTNGDEALDPPEILALAIAPAPPTARQLGFGFSGGYSFGDDAGLSSRKHIEDALGDLRVASDKTDRALPIIRDYLDHVENTARANLLSQMETLLSLEHFVTFKNVLDARQHVISFRPGQAGSERIALPMGSGIGNAARRLDGMGLGPEKAEQARAAIEQYKSRIRLGSEEERSELMTRLKDVLDAEELENYDAAIQRRPVVASSFTLAMQLNDALRERRSGAVPAVLIERVTPAGVVTR